METFSKINDVKPSLTFNKLTSRFGVLESTKEHKIQPCSPIQGLQSGKKNFLLEG